MAKLTLEEFRCVVDTDELGDESPYFVTWVGDLTIADCKTKYTRKPFWENKVSPGPWWPVHETIIHDIDFALVPLKTLVLAAMIEEDEGEDLSKQEAETQINDRMREVFRVHAQRHPDSNESLLVNTMRNTFRAEILKHMAPAVGADDDLMEEDDHRAVQRVPITGEAGEPKDVTFEGGNGRYVVRYTRS